MSAKLWIALGIEMAIAGLLFGAAGTLSWPPAWAFVGVSLVVAFLITRMVARHDPSILKGSLRWPILRAELPWDGIFMILFTVLFPGWLALMGLDAVRFDWSWMPDWLQIVGGIGVAAALSSIYRIFEENTFPWRVVHLRKDNGRRIISTGPYAVVRHPLYAAGVILFVSTALLLGSWFGLAGVVVLASAIVSLTAMEDRALYLKLDGYADYARRVRYRLFPGVW
ncbi:MAG TPA: isoprenylcysteine carboxylmethyltransferase family protein [Rhizomicrobium sp.]|jgi:protein-S-isoprenylcysteine O-methyltransferase Ste14